MTRTGTPAGRLPTVWVVGPLPPPVHGAARVTDLVRRAVVDSGRARVRTVDTGDGGSGSGLGLLLRRLARMISGLGQLLVARRRSGTVYIGGAGGEVLWYQAVVVLLARMAGLPTVFHHHSYYYLTQTRWSMRLISTFGGRRLTHVVLCPGMGDELQRRYPRVADVLVCSNAGLLGPASARAPRPTGPTLRLGHLSNLSMEKGLGRVLDTVRRLRGAGVDVRLVLAGPTTDEETATLLAEATTELGDALTVLGRIDPDRVDEFYREVDVFVFPSLYAQEAEPLVVLDAARHGIPTLAHAVGCLPGMVAAGHAVPVDTDFAARAVELLTDDSPLGPTAAVAETFTARREAALGAHQTLVARLLT